jgi:hypothetical protein
MAPVSAIRETGSSAMDRTTAIHLLQVMIDYFEAGNQHTDAVAKSIINLGLLKRLNSINLVSL